MIINIINPHASYYLGGTEVVTLEQALALGRRGHTVRYFTWETPIYSDYFEAFLQKAKNLDITPVLVPRDPALPMADGSWPRYYYLSNRFGIAAQPYYAQYVDADLFVSHLSADSLYVPSGVKHILHLHGTPSVPDAMIDTALQLPDAALAHATSIRDWWHEYYPSLPIDFFRNGIDTTAYQGSPAGKRPIDVLYVGRFMEHKGIDDILTAVSSETNVVIAGHGPYETTLRSLIHARGLRNVKIIINPPTDKLKQLYQQTKLFVCPSRAKEGVLTTMLEAGASGATVITAHGSGMTDLIREDYNGAVVPAGSPKELSKAMQRLLGDENERIHLAETLQKNIRNEWSWEAKGGELENAYAKHLTK